jgi:hypothetical protein
MNKKLLFVCFVFLAITNYALAYGTLIGSWENQTNEGWYDFEATSANNWEPVYIDDSRVNPLPYSFCRDWSTDGDYSLKTAVYEFGIFQEIDVKNNFFDNSMLEMDIFATGPAFTNDNQPNWAGILRIVLQSSSNVWYEMPNSEFYIGMGEQLHVVFPYWLYKSEAQPTDNYIKFIFELFSGNTAPDTYSNLYIDNVRLIPEPATLSLLGLGGLALLRRRKQINFAEGGGER